MFYVCITATANILYFSFFGIPFLELAIKDPLENIIKSKSENTYISII